MASFDMCVQGYNAAFQGASDLKGRTQVLRRRFVGTDFTKLSVTAADTFRIFKIGKHQMVDRVWTIVTDKDDTAITLDIGYTDGTNTVATAFETDAALDDTGVTQSSDDVIFFDDDGYYIILTFSALATLDDDFEMVIAVEVTDLRDAGVTEVLTAPV